MGIDTILAIDTSTRYGGVALWKGDTALASVCWYSSRNHTSELMPAIEYVLGRAEARSQELEGIAVALGPGGFSALRVGISAAKGLALPLNLRVVGVGTLEIEAYPYAGTGLPICPILDSGRGQVATALFQQSEGGWGTLGEMRACTPEELAGSVTCPTLFCGEGAPRLGEYLKEALGRNGLVLGFHTPAARLWALGFLGMELLKGGATGDMAALQPLYLRGPSIGAPKAPRAVRR